ncbi:dihydroxyacetone kinase subunit L [Clostridioides difficile]|nr:dihydroxyacetone kinase subunit L [Clostridioides difficile]
MLNSNDSKQILLSISNMFIEKEEELSKYDSVIGDGDHGTTMARGAKAAKEKIENLDDGGIRDYYKLYGRTLVSTLGGAMGPLYGSIFLELSKACRENDLMGVEDFYNGFKNGLNKVMDLGGAKPGDKTMIDSMVEVVKSLDESVKNNHDLKFAFQKAVLASKRGVEITKSLVAKRGRSKYLQQKAIGHQDAGATSFSYMIETINNYIQNI